MTYKKLLAVAIFSTLPFTANADQYQDTYTSYIEQDPTITANLYPEIDVDLFSPYFLSTPRDTFTTYKEMVKFMTRIAEDNDWAELNYLGKSGEGKKIPYLTLSNNEGKNKKVRAWLQGAIHGNEPSSNEALLALLGNLEQDQKGTSKLLSNMDIIVIPVINADGVEYFQRRNSRSLDLNRDHLKMASDETLQVKQLFTEFNPHVVADSHEYGPGSYTLSKFGDEGYEKYYDVLVASARNPNIDSAIRDLSNGPFLKDMQKSMDKYDISHEIYSTYGSGDNGYVKVTEAGTSAIIGRNQAGLTNTITYLFETRGIGLGDQHFQRRVVSMLKLNESFLASTMKNRNKILKTIEKAENETIYEGLTASNNIILKTESPIEYKDYTFVDLANKSTVTMEVEYHSTTDVTSTLEVTRPYAYILPPAYGDIIEKLEALGIEVTKTTGKMTKLVEAYNITESSPSSSLYEGVFRNYITGIEPVMREITFPKGTYIISMAQPNADLAAITLEPESTDSYATFGLIPVSSGDQYPVFRDVGY
ncbi:M14 family metallocarboxypeptidase [Vibrio sp. SS-MA-C1-2]|uniref:M14 family metallopeptidase n=1 Tax=Vibrio sp. SS-MA-C1-2 TaxID=2908646 RepID=UPI001F244C15|nr:M14 family metallocarboxypeptidase [Vibrio sp. SS-MA-C1-2]UJF17782.1 M14 family metallocarboxypeptidase [Vibrio sp. SS-MA-C1-2]